MSRSPALVPIANAALVAVKAGSAGVAVYCGSLLNATSAPVRELLLLLLVALLLAVVFLVL